MNSGQKKKRVSKKSKLSWRKYVDISDVENFLEEKQLEERLGKPVAEKSDNELFLIDAAPTSKAVKSFSSKENRRKILRESIPKCFSILQSHTAVPASTMGRNHLKTKAKSDTVIQKKLKKLALKFNKSNLLNSGKLAKRKKSKNKEKVVNFAVDVWKSGDLNKVEGEWIHEDTKKHTLHGTSQYRKHIPSSVLTKTSILPSIEVPHPGTSYNPNFKDHQNLLRNVSERERKLMKEELHLQRVTAGMFRKVTAGERDNNWLVEMTQGLEKKSENADESDSEYKSINPPVQNKKKDLKKRRKHREHQKVLHAIQSVKKAKKKITDIHKLNILKEEIEKDNKKKELLQSKRLKKQTFKKIEPNRLSRRKFEEHEIDFNIPQDISGNLRNIKKEGSLLLDRFKSFERRNILRPSTKHVQKKGKFRRFTKPGHKDDWKTTVARPNVL